MATYSSTLYFLFVWCIFLVSAYQRRLDTQCLWRRVCAFFLFSRSFSQCQQTNGINNPQRYLHASTQRLWRRACAYFFWGFIYFKISIPTASMTHNDLCIQTVHQRPTPLAMCLRLLPPPLGVGVWECVSASASACTCLDSFLLLLVFPVLHLGACFASSVSPFTFSPYSFFVFLFPYLAARPRP